MYFIILMTVSNSLYLNSKDTVEDSGYKFLLYS